MTFGRKVQHRTRLMFSEQLGQQHVIANVTLHKNMLRVVRQRRQRRQVACVG